MEISTLWCHHAHWNNTKAEMYDVKKAGMIYDNVSKVRNVVTNFNVNVHSGGGIF